MSSDEGNQRKKMVKKEMRKWVKQTKIVKHRVGSAVFGLLRKKKPESPASNGFNQSESDKGSAKKISFLSNLFRKGKIKKIQPESEKEEGRASGLIPNRVSSSWRVSAKPKLKIARRSVTVRRRDESEPLDEDPGNDLCKRRILMGGKCKPLEVSVLLHSDQNGAVFYR